MDPRNVDPTFAIQSDLAGPEDQTDPYVERWNSPTPKGDDTVIVTVGDVDASPLDILLKEVRGLSVDRNARWPDGTGPDAGSMVETILANGGCATELVRTGAVAAKLVQEIPVRCKRLDPVVASCGGVGIANQDATVFVHRYPQGSVSAELSVGVAPTPEDRQDVALG